METATELQSISLTQLIKKGVVTGISELRTNTNDYPFVTFLKGSKSTNVYFGQKTSEKVAGTFQKGDNINSFLKECSVVKTTNKEGEVRYKLSHSTSGYTTGFTLASEFGLDDIQTDFPVEEFSKEFQAKVNEQIPQA